MISQSFVNSLTGGNFTKSKNLIIYRWDGISALSRRTTPWTRSGCALISAICLTRTWQRSTTTPSPNSLTNYLKTWVIISTMISGARCITIPPHRSSSLNVIRPRNNDQWNSETKFQKSLCNLDRIIYFVRHNQLRTYLTCWKVNWPNGFTDVLMWTLLTRCSATVFSLNQRKFRNLIVRKNINPFTSLPKRF